MKFIIYTIAQNLGAFVGSILVYLCYLNEFSKYEPGWFSVDSSSVFGTLPRNVTSASGIETFSLFWDQFYATTLFITCILAICDDNNTPAKIPHTIKAVLVGLTLAGIGTAFGINCGFAVNPARDFGPRMFTLIFGWGGKVFTAGPYFFWIPIAAPMCGGAFAVIIYQLFIGNNFKADYTVESASI